MADQTKIFKMTNDGIFLNESEKIPYEKTNLPKDYFLYSTKEVYWKVRAQLVKTVWKEYITIDVIDYDANDLEQFNQQKLKGRLPWLQFQNLNWEEFIKPIYSYAYNKINADLFNSETYQNSEYKPTTSVILSTFPKIIRQEHLQPGSVLSWHNGVRSASNEAAKHSFKVRLVDLDIFDGYAQTKYSTVEYGEQIIKVMNVALRKEYNLIKGYFANKLKKQYAHITFSIGLKDEKINIEATSPEIELIDETFIGVIRLRQIKSILKVERASYHKSIYTIDEIIKETSKELGGVLTYSIDDIIKVLTKDYTHRNSKQLNFLAEQHKVSEDLVRLSLTPNFGFVFFLEGKNYIHYVWELLNSHATYIWSFPKSFVQKESALEKVELAINEIEVAGRNTYKTQFKNTDDCSFKVLEHKMTEDKKGVLFTQWHQNLTSVTSS